MFTTDTSMLIPQIARRPGKFTITITNIKIILAKIIAGLVIVNLYDILYKFYNCDCHLTKLWCIYCDF